MSNSKYTLILDSSQISSYLGCPQRWYNSQIKKIFPTYFKEDQIALNCGTLLHKYLDLYYSARAQGIRDLSTLWTLMEAYNPDKETCKCGCLQEHHKFITENIQECARCNKCLAFNPVPFQLDPANRYKVLHRFRDYMFKYQAGDFEVTSPKQVEVGFSEVLYEDSENLFILEGRIDLLPTWQGLECIVDHKGQMTTHWLYPRSTQFKNYALISKRLLFVINYVRFKKDLDEHTLARRVINFSAYELSAWRGELIKIYFRIKGAIQLAESSNGETYKDWNACSGHFPTSKEDEPKYCYYTELCNEPNPEMKLRKEKTLYKIQENLWRPW